MELKALMKYRAEQLGYEEDFRGLGLTSRKNLCLHPSVKREKSGSIVDARCRSLTAGFVKEKKDRGENVDVCVYHDVRGPPNRKFSYPETLPIFSKPAKQQSGLLGVNRANLKTLEPRPSRTS